LHEFTVAQSIVDAVLSEAETRKAKHVNEISVEVGQLTQIDTSILRYALKLLLTGSVLGGAKVHLHVAKVRFACRRCGHEWTLEEAKRQLSEIPEYLLVKEPDSKELPLHFLPYLYPAFVHCKKCGSADAEAKTGKEVLVRRMVMD
jgi:hydrogenase nickel incorporation protein HypA/HybF